VVVSDATPKTEWLIDKSALTRLGASTTAAVWAERIQRGMVRIATVTLLEVGYSARSATDLHAGLRSPPVSSMPIVYATPVAEDRAVQDLIIAALAESAGLVVVHNDKAFDLIAEVTDQPVQRLVD